MDLNPTHWLKHWRTKKRIRNWSREDPLKIHIGCGRDHWDGYVNADMVPSLGPDLICPAHRLPVSDSSVDEISSCHLFEHLEPDLALATLAEWHRALKPGGTLHIEMPDLGACIELLGKHFNKQGYDLAMIGIYGYPPDIKESGYPQMHKWGYRYEDLERLLIDAGFEHVRRGDIQQSWRPATAIGRDMHVVASRT